jgi:hypothetical protein
MTYIDLAEIASKLRPVVLAIAFAVAAIASPRELSTVIRDALAEEAAHVTSLLRRATGRSLEHAIRRQHRPARAAGTRDRDDTAGR